MLVDVFSKLWPILLCTQNLLSNYYKPGCVQGFEDTKTDQAKSLPCHTA